MSKNNQSNHNHGSKSEPNKRKRRDTKPLPSSSSDSDMDEASHLVLYTETGEYAILVNNVCVTSLTLLSVDQCFSTFFESFFFVSSFLKTPHILSLCL